jgi:hypothetical protein
MKTHAETQRRRGQAEEGVKDKEWRMKNKE